MTEAIYFTLAAIVLYWFSDWCVQRIEQRVGRRLEQRSLIFFAILLMLALVSFWVIRSLGSAT